MDIYPMGSVAFLHRIGYIYKPSKTVSIKAYEAKQQAFLEEQLTEILQEVKQQKTHFS